MTLALFTLYLAIFLLPAVVVAAYHMLLMVAKLAGACGHADESTQPSHTFAIVIPAHNEDEIIARVLKSCADLDYPADKYRVFVIADNCTDRTAAVSRSLRASCLERHDVERAGKGHALEWGFGHILPLSYDAVVVLDADCVIERHALRAFDQCLIQGDRALQANYTLSNPDASPISYLARIGNVLEYEYFYAPKSALGLAVMLVGTGMVFRSDILRAYPWKAHSAVEDAEYTLTLARHNVRVRFLPNVAVLQPGAERPEQLTVQRKRWAGGTLQLGRRSAFGLIAQGILTARLLLADAGFTLLIVSRPLVLLHLAVTLALGTLLSIAYPGALSRLCLGLGLGAFAAYAVYFSVGVALVGVTARRVRFLVSSPLVLARLMTISLRATLATNTPWVRTPR